MALDGGKAPKVAVVLPRNTAFGPAGATSVDLCVADLVRHSLYASSTRVICDWVDAPFADIQSSRIRYAKDGGNRARIREVVNTLRADPPDLIITHQHLPTAARLRDAFSAPVLLQTHNFQKQSKNPFGRLQRNRDYGRLDGLVFVSSACLESFRTDYPANNAPKAVVENGLDLNTWQADKPRAKTILVVGRAIPEKGMLEAIRALGAVLPDFADWRAEFVLSECEKYEDYFALLKAEAAESAGQIIIHQKLPYAEVQAKYEEAAIALVLSKWREPFGRTALEAHAAGAALISSGTGGLKEISGEHALYADPQNHAVLQTALRSLMRDETLRRRLAAGGRQRIETLFDVRAVAAKLDDFYTSIFQADQRTVA